MLLQKYHSLTAEDWKRVAEVAAKSSGGARR